MSLVRVWNDNVYPFSQEYKGKKISIEPGKYVMMEPDEAVEFRGMYSPIIKDKDGNPHPRGYKMIRVDHNIEPPVSETFKHPLTGKTFASKKDYEESLEETAELAITDEVAEAEIKLAQRRGKAKQHGDHQAKG